MSDSFVNVVQSTVRRFLHDKASAVVIANSDRDTMTFYTLYMNDLEIRLAYKRNGSTARFLILFKVGKLTKDALAATPTDLDCFQTVFRQIMTDYAEGRATAHLLGGGSR